MRDPLENILRELTSTDDAAVAGWAKGLLERGDDAEGEKASASGATPRKVVNGKGGA